MKIQWFDSAINIKEEDWNKVYPDEIMKSRDFFLVLEKAFEKDIKYHYLYIYTSTPKQILAIIPCFEFRLNFDLLASRRTQVFVSKIRKYYQNFFSCKVLVLGSFVATCEQYIGIQTNDENILNSISNEIDSKAKELKCSMSMIKEVPIPDLGFIKKIFRSYTFVDSMPNSFVPIDKNFRPYPSGLKTKARQRFNRAKRDFIKNKLFFEIINDFTKYSEIAYNLYKNVLKKSKTKFDFLNPNFFKEIDKTFPDKTFLLLIRDEKENIRSIELILECKNKLIPMYIGLDYSYHDVKCLYFNTIIRSIEFAEEKGLDYVVLGQNNYYPKILSGAIMQKGLLGFYSSNKLISFFIRNSFNKLFPEQKRETEYVYSDIEKIVNFCNKHSIDKL